MTNASDSEILGWIGYWDRSSQGPTLSMVHSVEDMASCRRFNPVLQTHTTCDRTDADMFRLLTQYREAA